MPSFRAHTGIPLVALWLALLPAAGFAETMPGGAYGSGPVYGYSGYGNPGYGYPGYGYPGYFQPPFGYFIPPVPFYGAPAGPIPSPPPEAMAPML